MGKKSGKKSIKACEIPINRHLQSIKAKWERSRERSQKHFFSKETLTPGTDTRAADKRQRG